MIQNKIIFNNNAVLSQREKLENDSKPYPVFVCNQKEKLIYRNKCASEQFPSIRTGSLFSRFCDIRIDDCHPQWVTLLGKSYQAISRSIDGGLFAVEFPEAVDCPEELPALEMDIQELSLHTQKLIDTLSLKGLEAAATNSEKLRLKKGLDLCVMLRKCLEDLRHDGNHPEINLCMQDLLEAIRRRTRLALEKFGADFSYDCAQNVLCPGNIPMLAFIILNIICFVKIYFGGKSMTAKVTSQDNTVKIGFSSEAKNKLFSAYTRLFAQKQELFSTLLFAPLAYAHSAAKECGYSLWTESTAKDSVVYLSFNVRSGLPVMTVIDTDMLTALDGFGWEQLTLSLLESFE